MELTGTQLHILEENVNVMFTKINKKLKKNENVMNFPYQMKIETEGKKEKEKSWYLHTKNLSSSQSHSQVTFTFHFLSLFLVGSILS